MNDETTTLVIGGEAKRRLQSMLATWEARQQVLATDIYLAREARDEEKALGLQTEREQLDRSVVNALCSMLRLGGTVWPDNQDPPSLIVNSSHLTYGVSVLRQIGMQWSVDS